MRAVGGLLSLLLPTLALAQQPAVPVQRVALANGLDIVVVEDHRLPVVSVQLWIKAGSARAPAAQPTLAALTERLLWSGARARPGERLVPPAISVGGETNAWTTPDAVVFHDEVAADGFEVALRAQGERVRAAAINDKTLAQAQLELQRLRSERLGDEPWSPALLSLFATSYQSHPYRWPTFGWPASDPAVRLDDVRAFVRRTLLPNNATLVVVGDVTLAAVKAAAQRQLGPWRKGPLPDPVPAAEPEQTGARRAVVRAEAESAALLCGVQVPGYADPDLPALRVATRLLAQNQDSRLHRALVNDARLAYLVQGELVRLAQSGLLYIGVAVPSAAALNAAEPLLAAELTRLATTPVSASELGRAIHQLEAEYVFSLERVGSLASRLGEATVLGGNPELVNREVPALRAVDAAAVQRVVRRYLAEDRRTLVQLLPLTATSAPAAAPVTSRPPDTDRWLREEFSDE